MDRLSTALEIATLVVRTVVIPGFAYLGFGLLAILGPGLALFRAARARVDVGLVLPLGFAACAGVWWLALVLGLPWLFPLLILAADAGVLLSWRGLTRAEGPSLRGAILPLAALAVVFAATEYPRNRLGLRGEYLFCSIVPEDMAFHAGLAWELSTDYPPQVPGFSGAAMGYHNGLPLVRGAAARWANVRPLDQMSRFEITLMALVMILALRSIVFRLGGGPRAVMLAGYTVLATDFSFLLGAFRWREAWLYLTDSNLLFSLTHANSSVAAIALALAALIALDRSFAGEGRGYLWLAMLLAYAVPLFKAFVGAHLLCGLGAAALLRRRFKEPILLAVPSLAALGWVVLGRASSNMETVFDPLTIVKRLQTNLEVSGGFGSLLVWTVLWIGASLGLRMVGLPAVVRSLRSSSFIAVAISFMALIGWPIGLIFRVMPLDYAGWRPPYNEAWYFIEQSAPLLWIFTVVALARIPLRGARAAVAGLIAAALAFPSTVQFAVAHWQSPQATAPPAIVQAMAVLETVGRRGDVVLMRPEPKRYPPPPMVLVGRRVPFTRFIPYLYQVAPRDQLMERIGLVREFFKTTDPKQARAVARSLHARFVCLFGDDEVAFPTEGILRPLYLEPNARLYQIVEDSADVVSR